MNSLRYFTSCVTYDINEHNNPFFIIYLISGFLLFFSILSLFTEKPEHQIKDDQLLNYLEEISYDNNLLEKCEYENTKGSNNHTTDGIIYDNESLDNEESIDNESQDNDKLLGKSFNKPVENAKVQL